MLLQAIHPSTAKLIRRLAEMTANRQLDWQEADQNGVQLAVADYMVAIRLDPVSLVITTLAGEELERVDSDQLQAMSAADFESYAQLLTVLHSNALRAARKVESAVQNMLEELDAEEALGTSDEAATETSEFAEFSELNAAIDIELEETAEPTELDESPKVTIELEPDEQAEDEVPFVLGGLADFKPKASDTAEALSDLDDSGLPELDDWGTADPEPPAEAPMADSDDSSPMTEAAWPSDSGISGDAEEPSGTADFPDLGGWDAPEPAAEAAEPELMEERAAPSIDEGPERVIEDSASLEIPMFLRRQADAGSASAAPDDGVESEGSDQGFNVVEHLERFEDDPFGVDRGPGTAAEAPSGAAPAPSMDAVDSVPPAPAVESPGTGALSLEEMRWVQNQAADPASSVVFGGFGMAEQEKRDDVECSIFAPRSSSAGKLVQVQVFLHTLDAEQRQAAELTAEKIDSLASLRSRKALSLSLADGTPVQILLMADDPETRQSFELASPLSEQTVWHGAPTSVSFFCRVDGFASLRNHLLKCLVSVEGVPVGEFKFAIEVTPMADADSSSDSDLTEPEAEKYQSVFLSYAREDKDEVDRVARVYNTMGMTVHRDISSLQPGEVFEDRLMAMLRSSDAFVLIWSQNAQNSEAVREEVKEALRVEQSGGKPRFLPFPIEGPPIPMPWPEFADRHIGDPIYHRG